MREPFIVIVAGGSGSGKTTLISRLAERLRPLYAVARMAMDDYYRDLSALPLRERRQNNFDHPDALDLDLFMIHLTELRQGKAVAVPVYDFSTHSRDGTRLLSPPDVLFVDGIFGLFPNEVASVADFSFFLNVPDSTRFQRRMERDLKERGREPHEVTQQYALTVRPMYVEYVAPTLVHADRMISLAEQQGKGLEDSLSTEIIERIRKKRLNY